MATTFTSDTPSLLQQMRGSGSVLLNHPTQSATAIDGWKSTLFGIPFCAVGAFITFAVLNHTPGHKNGPGWIVLIFAATFSCAGLILRNPRHSRNHPQGALPARSCAVSRPTVALRFSLAQGRRHLLRVQCRCSALCSPRWPGTFSSFRFSGLASLSGARGSSLSSPDYLLCSA